MHSLLEKDNLNSAATGEPNDNSASGGNLEGPTISMVRFVESSFIPNHVALKAQAGRTHYHAILKYVLRPETVDRLLLPYRGICKSKLRSIPEWPYLDETRLCDITPDHVRRLTSLAVSHGYSPQTVKHIKNVISAIISHAKKERIFSGDNPMTEVHLPPVVRKASPAFSLVEAKAIFRMMEYPERQIALIIFNTTMNVSEVCGLQWCYVNPTLRASYVDGEIVPPRSILVKYQRTSSGFMRVSADRIRVINISTPLLDLLTTLRRERRRRGPDDFLFANRLGTPFSPASIHASRLKPIGRQFGISFSWHTLKEVHDVFLQDLYSKLNSELAAL
jgi:integrase